MDMVVGLVGKDVEDVAAGALADLDLAGRPHRVALHPAPVEPAFMHRLQQLLAERVLASPRQQHRVRTQCAEMTADVERRTAQHIAIAELVDQGFAKGHQGLHVGLRCGFWTPHRGSCI
jgi:hypothetical protein